MGRVAQLSVGDGIRLTTTAIKVLKEMLENARQTTHDLSKKLNIAQTTISWIIRERLSKLGGKYVYFLHPKKLGMDTALVRVKPDPQKLEEAAAYLTVSPLVRMLSIDPNRDEIWLIVVGPEWRIREFKHRLRTTPAVRDYEIIPLSVRKFEQPIPPELLDDLVRGESEK